MTLNLVFTASQLDVQYLRVSVENKPASFLVVPWERHLTEFPHLSVVDRWPATPKRARTELRRFLVIGG